MKKAVKILDGRYRVVKKLSKMSQRKVYLSEHIRLNTFWIIKESSADSALKKEACILKRLNNPFIPRVVDYFYEGDNSYMVEDYIDGESLNEMIQGKNKIDTITALRTIYQLCKILDYLHNAKPYPIIHCDIKPSNVMSCYDGSVKLVDFGASKFMNEQWIRPSFGTIGYAAPEQYGLDSVGAETDIFALGALLYHMLVGKPPRTPVLDVDFDFDKAISFEVRGLIKKCTETHKSLRYSNVKRLSEAILDVIQSHYEQKNLFRNRNCLQI